MDTQVPHDNEHPPVERPSLSDESAQAQHTRELTQSLDALEDTVETGVMRVLEKAIPFVLGVSVACIGLYFVARRLRSRAQQRRAARSA